MGKVGILVAGVTSLIVTIVRAMAQRLGPKRNGTIHGLELI
jgi:hypothetical protein